MRNPRDQYQSWIEIFDLNQTAAAAAAAATRSFRTQFCKITHDRPAARHYMLDVRELWGDGIHAWLVLTTATTTTKKGSLLRDVVIMQSKTTVRDVVDIVWFLGKRTLRGLTWERWEEGGQFFFAIIVLMIRTTVESIGRFRPRLISRSKHKLDCLRLSLSMRLVVDGLW